MADFSLPKPIGIPMNDVTKTSAPPTPPAATPSIPVQPTIPAPVDQAAETAARSAEKFAWAPDQAKQVTGIMETQRSEYNQRADRVAKNQMTQQTLAEVERVKGLIAAEVEAIRVLNGEISTINSEISKITSEISSTQSAVDSAKAEAANILRTPVTASPSPQPAAVGSSMNVPSSGIVTPDNQAAEAATRRVQEAEIQQAQTMKDSQRFQQLRNYVDTVGNPNRWKAENEANATLTRMGAANMSPAAISAVRADIDRKYGAGQFDPQYMEYFNMSMEINRLGRNAVRSS